MKKVLSTLQGGFPITLDELEYIQTNVKELTGALGKAMQLSTGAFPIKLYGIEATITGSGGATPTVDVTAGALWYLDEIYFFDEMLNIALDPGETLQDFDTEWFFDLLETTNTSVVFKDASSKDINQVRKTILTKTPATWANLDFGQTSNFSTRLIATVPNTTESIPGKIELATQTEVNDGLATSRAVVPSTLKGVTDVINDKFGGVGTKVIEIGDWNMDSTSIVSINHNLTFTDIIGIQILIRDDGNSLKTELSHLDSTTVSGTYSINSTLVTMIRTSGGFYDNTTYDQTSFNRGWVILSYLL